MSASRPQSKLSEVSDFMNQHQGIIDPNRLELRRWLNDARALRQSEPAAGYMMEGLVYRAQGNIVKGTEYLKKSYRIDPLLAGKNYVSLLTVNGNFDEAESVALKLIQNSRTDVGLLRCILVSLPHTLNKNNLIQAIDVFKPTNSDAEKVLKTSNLLLKDMDKVLHSLKMSDVSIDTYKRYWKLVSNVRNSNYMGNSNVTVDHQVNELGVFLTIDDSLHNISIDNCIRMNDELIEAIIDDDYPFDEYRKIVFNFSPAENSLKNMNTDKAFRV